MAMACSCVCTKILQKMWEGPFWEGVWPCLDPLDSVRLRTASTYWNISGKYGPHNERRAIEVIGQDWSSEVALFLEGWELGRVALSCHMAMNLLCQEMTDACWDSSGSLGSRCSL